MLDTAHTPTTDLSQSTSTYTAMLAAARAECANPHFPMFTRSGLYITLVGHPAFNPGEFGKTWRRLVREGRFKLVGNRANPRYTVKE